MQKTYKVLSLNIAGATYSCIYHTDEKINPLWVYRHTREVNEFGYRTERKRRVAKYADINSVLYYLAQTVR